MTGYSSKGTERHNDKNIKTDALEIKVIKGTHFFHRSEQRGTRETKIVTT